jgi:predicted Zn-dependent peptidase
MAQVLQHRLSNGLWLVAEPVAGAQSLAMTLLLPAGVAHEPAERQGVAALLSEMMCRGAGDLDARAHSDALDSLGIQRHTGVEVHHLRLGALFLGTKMREALPLLLDMAIHPQLAAATLEPSRDLALQSIAALEDEPQQKVFVELRQRHYPQPYGRSTLGRKEYLEAATLEDVREYWRDCFVPDGAVLGFAGNFDFPALRDAVEAHLGSWRGRRVQPDDVDAAPRGYLHQDASSTQVHIGLAYDAPPETDPASILQKAAIAVLSGGMSGRLFTEVREKRGLCYSVFARYGGDQRRGTVFSYAGTTTARAQETFDVLTSELRRLAEGIEPGEFDRAIVGMRAGLVMQGESTGARAASIAADQYLRGRPRSLEELDAEVRGITLEALRAYVRGHPPGAMTVVSIGAQALKMP